MLSDKRTPLPVCFIASESMAARLRRPRGLLSLWCDMLFYEISDIWSSHMFIINQNMILIWLISICGHETMIFDIIWWYLTSLNHWLPAFILLNAYQPLIQLVETAFPVRLSKCIFVPPGSMHAVLPNHALGRSIGRLPIPFMRLALARCGAGSPGNGERRPLRFHRKTEARFMHGVDLAASSSYWVASD